MYSVKYNKVVINKKSYVYCPVTDHVLSVVPVDNNNENGTNLSPHSSSVQAFS